MKAVNQIIIVVGLLAVLCGLSIAEVPQLINYQGRLTDNSGDVIVDGSYSVTFTIYDASSGGASVWTETQSVNTHNGLFVVLLGSVNPVLDSVFNSATRYLGVAVEGDPELVPRLMLVTVPYSYKSLISDSTESITDGAIDLSDIGENGALSGQIVEWDGSSWITVDKSNNSRWHVQDSILYTNNYWGMSRDNPGTVLSGDSTHTLVNFGVGSEIINTYYSTISGGINNRIANSPHSTIAGGLNNLIKYYIGNGTISGGTQNIVDGAYGTIGGGENNYLRGSHSFIGGGDSNYVSGLASIIVGGIQNKISIGGGGFNSIVGGRWNLIESESNSIGGSFIGGGHYNFISSQSSSILGGDRNSVSGHVSAIISGNRNSVTGMMSTILSGTLDTVTADYSCLIGLDATLTQDSTFMVDMPHIQFGAEGIGYEMPTDFGSLGQVLTTDGAGLATWSNVVSHNHNGTGVNSFIGGGLNNIANGDSSTVSGGAGNTASGRSSTIGGGHHNSAGEHSVVAGGWQNSAGDYSGVVAGGYQNTTGSYGAIGGGSANSAGSHGHVGGGSENIAGGFSSICGGSHNSAIAASCFIGGGWYNTVEDSYSTIVGGAYNTIDGQHSFIGGGQQNTSVGNYTTISGGQENETTKGYATVPGGRNNTAAGLYSFAAGRRSKALHDGCFVWSDNSDIDFESTERNQFLINAEGGVGVNTNRPNSDLHINGSISKKINIVSEDYYIHDDDCVVIFRAGFGTKTIYLPTAVGRLGRVYTIKCTKAGAPSINLTPFGSETIDEVGGARYMSNNATITIISDGINWLII